MKLRTLGRHIREGSKNLKRNGWMTFASISAVTVLLFVVGASLLLILNLNHLVESVEDDVEIWVYIDLLATDEEQLELRSELEAIDDVESVEYLSKEEGLERFIESLDEHGKVFESMRDENPLNDVFIVRAETPQLTEQVAKKIETLPHIERINYGKDVVRNLFAFTKLFRIVGAIIVVTMLFTAMFLIANTIKLTILARKNEIQIMKLVGATNSFIRWPFFIEGILLGTLGAIIPIVVISFSYAYIIKHYESQFDFMFFSLLPPNPFLWQISLLLLGIGAFIGVWGSLMSVRKFLKI